MDRLFKISLRLKKKFEKGKKNFKRFSRNPLFYLGIISNILFWLIIFNPSFNQKDFYFSAGLENFQKNSFIEPRESQLESPDLNLIQENSLIASVPPVMVIPQVLGAILGESEPEIKKEITEYIAQSGDNLWSIAKRFDISLNTLLWANNLNKNSIIKPGQKLIILPVSGVIHHVKPGETISQIAKIYKGKIEEIIAFNNLSEEGEIFAGDILIIPNGVKPSQPVNYFPSLAPIASNYFICPISPPCRITQGLHWYNAVDLSHGRCGESIYSAAGGKILRVKYGWNGGLGNYLTILHPNGVVTLYAHLQTIFVSPGQSVSQGERIALMGGKPGTPGAGRSTGCHLHFGVQGAKNPFTK
ncbi:MAG: LysM peptidoglycan-binding domain-containing protein [Patescibacteria group bacterium]|nr:LysM peptidoglycan-binding domain-containing protein [Patescibacteria group bacterium]